MKILNQIAQEVAAAHAGNSPAIMAQAFAEMIRKGIDRAVDACREGIPSMVDHNMPITIDTMDMDYIVGQGMIESGYVPDSRLAYGDDKKTVAREIALMVAEEYFSNSPQAMINGMAEMVEKGINKALEQIKVGFQKMATDPEFPKDPHRWNVSYALTAASS